MLLSIQISMHPWRDSWEGQPGGDWAAEVSLGWPLWSSLPRARANSWTSGTWEQKPLLTILAQFQGVEIFPTLPNQEAAIFTSMVGHGRACLIMANLSKPNGHSSHPVGNKLPQVKYYEVLGEFYELWGSPSINWSQPWKNNVMWTVEGNPWKCLPPLPKQRNCWSRGETCQAFYTACDFWDRGHSYQSHFCPPENKDYQKSPLFSHCT